MKRSDLIKSLVIALVVVLVIVAGILIYLNFQSSEKIVDDNSLIVGNDRDAHGCIGSAGYTWCEVKQKCLRSWEESC